LLALDMLEWGSTDEYLEKCDSKRPNVRFPGVVVVTTGTFRRKVLKSLGEPCENACKNAESYLRCAISKITPEGPGRTEVVLLGESEINQHGDVFIGEKDVRRSSKKVNAAQGPICHNTHLMSLCTIPRMWRNSTPLKSDLNQTLAIDSSTSTGISRGR
jgi:hypothetical protein